jgi:hypothetical protein
MIRGRNARSPKRPMLQNKCTSRVHECAEFGCQEYWVFHSRRRSTDDCTDGRWMIALTVDMYGKRRLPRLRRSKRGARPSREGRSLGRGGKTGRGVALLGGLCSGAKSCADLRIRCKPAGGSSPSTSRLRCARNRRRAHFRLCAPMLSASWTGKRSVKNTIQMMVFHFHAGLCIECRYVDVTLYPVRVFSFVYMLVCLSQRTRQQKKMMMICQSLTLFLCCRSSPPLPCGCRNRRGRRRRGMPCSRRKTTYRGL